VTRVRHALLRASHVSNRSNGRPGYPSRVARIYTKGGDDGTTGLLYGGRVSKADLATQAYGTTDEAVAALGLARAFASDPDLKQDLLRLQRDLFVVGADLATNPSERGRLEPGVSLVTDGMVRRLEERIDECVAAHPLRREFIVPGANPASASLDVARSVVRRAERLVVEARDSATDVNDAILRYLNRLSDLLFVLARIAAGEVEPPSRAR
jgi:cob(I)alamin adenosyltransferase